MATSAYTTQGRRSCVKERTRGGLRALLSLVPLATVLAASTPSAAASLTQVNGFGANPTNARMFVYVPDNKAQNPPILVVIHYCSGSANAMFTGTGFKGEADKYGFVVIYPETSSSDGCWDVHSTQSLSHDGGGDSNSIVNMVKYALTQYSANPKRVYATGTSSGAMMTNVLLGAYPEVFQGGAIFAGVPYACFAGTSGWNSDCADGKITKTGAQWGDLVRAANPGYTGYRPRVQIWHGTSDETLDYVNFGEEIKQWTNVLGVSETPSSTEMNQPQSGYTRTRYKDAGGIARVEAVSEAGQPHALMVPADQVSKFFGLDATSDPGQVGAAGSGAGGMGAGGASGGGMSGAGGTSAAGRSGAGASGAGTSGADTSGAGGAGMSGGGTGGVSGRDGDPGGSGPAGAFGAAGNGGNGGAAGGTFGTGGSAGQAGRASGGAGGVKQTAVGGSGGNVTLGGKSGDAAAGRGASGASGSGQKDSDTDSYDPPVGGGGCGCRAVNAGTSRTFATLLAVALVGLASARRRRRT